MYTYIVKVNSIHRVYLKRNVVFHIITDRFEQFSTLARQFLECSLLYIEKAVSRWKLIQNACIQEYIGFRTIHQHVSYVDNLITTNTLNKHIKH